jgi:Tfp pilus tip-associated adhesin PilY1
VFFNSFVPKDDPCSIGGYGWQYSVDMVTGGSPSEAATDYNKDGVVDESDMIDGKAVAATMQDGYMPEPVFIEDIAYTGDKPTKVVPLPNLPIGRFSWQELIR